MKERILPKRAALVCVAAVLFVLLSAACTTTPYSQREKNVERVVELIHSGDTESLVSQSQLPFLFDTEIIMLERDVRSMWKNLGDAGFVMENAEYEYIGPAGRYSYPPFADSMEVRTFFKRYLPEESSIVRVTAENGEFFLLLGPKADAGPSIIGYRMNI